jgi:hypothetical protein
MNERMERRAKALEISAILLSSATTTISVTVEGKSVYPSLKPVSMDEKKSGLALIADFIDEDLARFQ